MNHPLPPADASFAAIRGLVEADAERGHVARFGGCRIASHFQPIVSFSYGRVVAHEGLMRAWDTGGNFVPPPDLLAASERAGTLLEADRVACCIHVANYAAMGRPDGWLFLNLHPRAFAGAGSATTPAFMAALLVEHGLAPNRLVIEILEDAVPDDARLEDAVAALRAGGWGIALDDFGAGHSNFDRVWRIRPEIVKLDRSYAVRAAADAAARRMLPSIVSLLHEAGSLVLLEGIETAEQAMIAMDADVDFAQGYFFARPAPAVAVTAFDAKPALDELWPAFEARRDAHKNSYRELTAPYLNALGYASTLLAAGRSLEEASAGFIALERSERVFLLDADGFQVGANLVSPRFPSVPALAAFQDTSQACWSRRAYFRRAVEHPGKVQITRPYRSIATPTQCVTVSVSFLREGKLRVLCGDVFWAD